MWDRPPTPPATLTRARAIAMANGLRYAYTGNVRDRAGQSSICHACGQVLIARDGFEITAWHLDAAGRCRSCAAPCAGVFEAAPGTWGSRRIPVRMMAGAT
jgi:pyruvate formate lyase activating enzyme